MTANIALLRKAAEQFLLRLGFAPVQLDGRVHKLGRSYLAEADKFQLDK